MNIIIKKDWDWYIAEVKWRKNLYAFGYTKEQAINELKNVLDMMMDYYTQEISFQKKIQKHLSNKTIEYAV